MDRFDHYDGNRPGLIVYDVGGPNERTIRRSFHPQTGRMFSETEASVLGNTPKETIWDFLTTTTMRRPISTPPVCFIAKSNAGSPWIKKER